MREGLTEEKTPVFRMLLFVADHETNSQEARRNIEGICAQHARESCQVEVVDVLEDYRKALEYRVLITPTLLVLSTSRPIRIIGTLADSTPVLSAISGL
jgi:circadian clock protein KaiB